MKYGDLIKIIITKLESGRIEILNNQFKVNYEKLSFS